MKLSKWSLYYQPLAMENFENFKKEFSDSNQLFYTQQHDPALLKLWQSATETLDKIIAANMQRWLPVDVYFHMSAFSSVWFFSLHLKQPLLSIFDMKCTRCAIPVSRGKVRVEPNAISVVFYLSGVQPSDQEVLRRLFPTDQVDGNELTIFLD